MSFVLPQEKGPLEISDKSIYTQGLLTKKIESVQLMFPQDRNLHGKVFGGFLMRLVNLS